MTRSSLASLRAVEERLKSGLRIVVVPMESVHRVVIDAHVRVGSRFETPRTNGISHFVEHMLYRGIPDHPTAHAQSLAFEGIGGTMVAATWADHGSLVVSCPPESFAEALALFAATFLHPTFSGIETEKGIVTEEINEDLDEDGNQVDPDNLVRELAFGGHPLGLPITGTAKGVAGFDLDLVRRHHRDHYDGASSVVAVVGPVDEDRVCAEVSRAFDGLSRGERAESSPPEKQRDARWRSVRHAASQTDLQLAFRAPGLADPREPATELLLRTLDDGMATRLYERICDRRGLCYAVSAGYEAFEDVGLFEVSAEIAHERAAAVLDELLSVARELREEGPSAEEVDKAKRRQRWQMAEALDDPGEIAEFFAGSTLMGTARTPAGRVEQVQAVTRDEVRDAAASVLSPKGLSAVAVGLQSRHAAEALGAKVRSWCR